MTAPAPEFSRTERLDAIGTAPRTVAISAQEAERAALVRRFGLASLDRLEAQFEIARVDGGIRADGHVAATLAQPCSVTGDPVPVTLAEDVSLLFVSPRDVEAARPEEEIELDDSALDIIVHDGGAIDLGEAAAQTMALALDPFLRGPGAEAALKAAGVLSEEEARLAAGPLSGLAAMLKGQG